MKGILPGIHTSTMPVPLLEPPPPVHVIYVELICSWPNFKHIRFVFTYVDGIFFWISFLW